MARQDLSARAHKEIPWGGWRANSYGIDLQACQGDQAGQPSKEGWRVKLTTPLPSAFVT